MKRCILTGAIAGTITLLALFAASCEGAQVKFEWDASLDSTVTGYRLYLFTNAPPGPSTNWVARLDTAGTNVVWTNAVVGQKCWAYATATNSYGLESDPSNVIDFQVPSGPARLKFNAVTVTARIESSPSVLGPFLWFADLGTVQVPRAERDAFFRINAEISQQ